MARSSKDYTATYKEKQAMLGRVRRTYYLTDTEHEKIKKVIARMRGEEAIPKANPAQPPALEPKASSPKPIPVQETNPDPDEDAIQARALAELDVIASSYEAEAEQQKTKAEPVAELTQKPISTLPIPQVEPDTNAEPPTEAEIDVLLAPLYAPDLPDPSLTLGASGIAIDGKKFREAKAREKTQPRVWERQDGYARSESEAASVLKTLYAFQGLPTEGF